MATLNSPLRIYGSLLKNWWAADQANSVWQNTGATTPATTDGQSVAAFKDQITGALLTNGSSPGTLSLTGLNGSPGVAFNGSQSLALLNFYTTAARDLSWTFFIAFKNTVNSGANKFLLQVGNFNLMLSPAALNGWAFQFVGLQTSIVSTQEDNSVTIMAFSYDGTAATVPFARTTSNVRGNLEDINTSDIAVPSIQGITNALGLSANGATFTLGAISGGSFGFTGTVGEIGFVNGPSTSTQLKMLMGYLATKYSVTNKPLLLAIGDSHIEGTHVNADPNTNNPFNYTQLLRAALGTSYAIQQNAYGGRTLELVEEEMAGLDWMLWPDASSAQMGVVQIGSNDLNAYNSTTVISTYVPLRLLLFKRLAALGIQCMDTTVPPRDTIAAATLAAFTAWQKANFRSYCLGLNDLTTLLIGQPNPDGVTAGPSPAAVTAGKFQADRVHLTRSGEADWATATAPTIATTITNLIPPTSLVAVDHNTGPTAGTQVADYLQATKTDLTTGLDGVTVRAFLTSDYNALNRSPLFIKGQTITAPVSGVSGRILVPMYLAPGVAYTIEYTMLGLYQTSTRTIQT